MSGIFEVIWRIQSAKSWFETRDDTLHSPQFLAQTLMNTCWKLKLTPNWQMAEKYISLSLQRDVEDDHPLPIDLHYDLFFVASDGWAMKSKRCANEFHPKTSSQVVNMKKSVILEEKKESFLPEGVLTVCCKMWKSSGTIPKGERCLLRSVIGEKRMTINGTIPYLDGTLTINFMPPSEDISQISLDVFTDCRELKFRRKHVDCKNICWYYYDLYALLPDGGKKKFKETNNLTKRDPPIIHNSLAFGYRPLNYSSCFQNGSIPLELGIRYYPGVVSENKKSIILKE